MVSATHLILIPSYNPGPRLLATVREALECWSPVWVVVDGSTDGSHAAVEELARSEPGLRVILRPRNGGKGAAVLTGADAAADRFAIASGAAFVVTPFETTADVAS